MGSTTNWPPGLKNAVNQFISRLLPGKVTESVMNPWYIMGVLAALIILVLLCGGALVSPVGQIWSALIFLSVVAALVLVFGMASHKTWWKSGGGKSLALVGVAAFLGSWGIAAFTVLAQTWFRIHGLGVITDIMGPLFLIVTLIGGVGLLFRAMRSEGNPAWLVGFFILGILFSGTNFAVQWTYGARAARVHPLTGHSAWAQCSVAMLGETFVYPVWDEQKTCPLEGVGEPEPVDDVKDKALIKQWAHAGLAPGMNEKDIFHRTVCAVQKDRALAAASTELDIVAKYRAAEKAEEQFDCSDVGDAKEWLDEQGGLNGLLTFPNLILALFGGAAAAGLLSMVSSVGKGDGPGGGATPPHS